MASILSISGGGTRVAGDGEADEPTLHDSESTHPASVPRKHWNDYVEEGAHYPNLPLVQTINRMEFAPRMIRLGTGELAPSLLPEQSMRQLFSEIASSMDAVPLSYEEPLGSLQLRRELCLEMERRGINASPSNVLVVSGELQAFQLISAGLLERHSTILLEKPSYLYSIHAFQSAGILLNVGTLYDRGAGRQLRLSYAYASIEEMIFAMGKLAQFIRAQG